MKQSTATLVAILAMTSIFTAMIGCGGGGSSTTGSTNANGSTNATSSTATTTTATTATTAGGTTTAATTGTAGDFPADVIFFSQTTITGAATIKHMNSDGTNVVTFDTVPTNYSGYAPSPVDNQVAFGYSPTGSGNPNYAVLRNTTVNVSGSSNIDAGPYVFLSSLQFTPDGSKVVYVAQTSTGVAGLFVTNADGSGKTRLDDAEDAHLSPSGSVIVYTKVFGSQGEICRINIDGTGFVRMTSNTAEDWMPQWTKEGDRIYFSSNRGSSNFDIWSMDTDGLNTIHVLTTSDDEYGSSPNTGNTEVAFTRITQPSTSTGIYKVNVSGVPSETPLFISPDISPFLYWTRTNGRAVGTSSLMSQSLSPRQRRIIQRQR